MAEAVAVQVAACLPDSAPMSGASGWIGCDLDGTLADSRNAGEIGEPIPAMVERIKKHLEDGDEVRIVTARVAPPIEHTKEMQVRSEIGDWCRRHLGQVLPITCRKDYGMILLYDDRAVQVLTDTGIVVDQALIGLLYDRVEALLDHFGLDEFTFPDGEVWER